MPSTTPQGLPYPLPAEPPNVPADIQALAEAIDPYIAPGAVGTFDLADGAVTTPKLGDGAVTTPKLGLDSVTAPIIATGAVGNTELAAGAVTATKVNTQFLQTGLAQIPDNGNQVIVTFPTPFPGVPRVLVSPSGAVIQSGQINPPTALDVTATNFRIHRSYIHESGLLVTWLAVYGMG